MASGKIASAAEDEEAAGRAAAERLAHDWESRDWIPDAPCAAWARAAVERLGEIIAAQPAMLKASLRGADKGASTLSPRPFQGLVECLQNADDLGASSLRVAYRGGKRPELLIVHDGAPVTLANVGAMLLPWLSTKEGDADAAGRFGIGQRTLSALGGPVALHAPPFHFVMGNGGPQICEPQDDIPGIYSAADRDTMLVIPLKSAVTPGAIRDAVSRLDVDSLIFLSSIRRLSFHQLEDCSQDIEFALEVTPAGEGEIGSGDDAAMVKIADIAAFSSASGQEKPRRYRRYSTKRRVAVGEGRSNKATGASTPVGLCVRIDGLSPMRLYDRMPFPIETGLPIGLNAQFDPDAARSALLPNSWNRNRFADLGELVGWAAIHAFATETTSAWNHVPLLSETKAADEWLGDHLRDFVVRACHAVLIDRLEVRTEGGTTPVANIAYEAPELEALLTDGDVERLRPGTRALPRAGRDPWARWRVVLGELGQSEVVPVADALDILEGDAGRGAQWHVAFAALADEKGLLDRFTSRPSLLLADGRATARPGPADPWVLVRNARPEALATRLGLARRLHPAYFEEGAPTASFVKRLEELKSLFADRDEATDVFAILGRGGAIQGTTGPAIRLQDRDLVALRDAWAELPRERHSALGPLVGRRIEIKATWVGPDGRRASGWARPLELYLPAAIDREVDSFAKAAGRTPGLKWVQADYAKLLKQKAGRSAIGAQRLLSAWGVAREPRLIRPSDEKVLWARDTTPASPIGSSMRTAEQLQSIRAGGYATHLIDDHWSPDAEAVAGNIAESPVKTRRKRAFALLAVLSRAWERRYADFATAFPASAYNGYWSKGQEVRATWLARLAEIKWMPDAGNGLQRPVDLQLQMPGSAPAPRERSRTVARLDSQLQRSGVLAALGVKAGPTQRDLVERLRALRKEPVTAALSAEVSGVYQLLAASVRDRSDSVPEGRLSPAQLRNAFRAGPEGPGLLLVGGRWHSPEAVLRGPAIFGSRRPFAPNIEGLESLWKTLQVNAPSVSDALAVLKEQASAPPDATELGIMIRALTLVAGATAGMSPQLRATLRKLPLWTGTQWTTSRPVYALEGEALLESAPPSLMVWRPGLTSLGALEPLLEPLGVIRLSSSDFRATSMPAYGVAEGEEIRPTFARAVALLRQELVRADQALLDGLQVDWEELIAAPVVVDPELSIIADLPTGRVSLPARAHVGLEPLCLIVRSGLEAASAEGAGAAIASLFNGDRQKAAWAWAAVWPRATMGELPQGAILPTTRAEKGQGKGRLERLARQAAQRQSKGKAQSNGSGGTGKGKPQPVQVRRLRDLDDLQPSAGTIVNQGAKPSGTLVFAKRRPFKERTFDPSRQDHDSGRQQPDRSVLPPGSDREKLALDAVRRALRLDVEQLNDLRAARGVGVDAIDDLRQCYEIKMSSGATVPSDVNLSASEIEAAKRDPDFFLAVVTGLEEGAGKLRVRFIFDPLTQLDVRVKGDLTLTGVDKAEALEFEFDRLDP